MATTVTFRGVAYSLPSPGDSNDWGAALSAFLEAIAASQPALAVVATGVAGGVAVSGVSPTTGNGVQGQSTGSGFGVRGVSATGYGVIAQSDTESPAIAAFRIVPQDTQPTGPNSVGDLYMTSAGVLKACTVAGTPGTWVSVGDQ